MINKSTLTLFLYLVSLSSFTSAADTKQMQDNTVPKYSNLVSVFLLYKATSTYKLDTFNATLQEEKKIWNKYCQQVELGTHKKSSPRTCLEWGCNGKKIHFKRQTKRSTTVFLIPVKATILSNSADPLEKLVYDKVKQYEENNGAQFAHLELKTVHTWKTDESGNRSLKIRAEIEPAIIQKKIPYAQDIYDTLLNG